jgi:hypothetical protein
MTSEVAFLDPSSNSSSDPNLAVAQSILIDIVYECIVLDGEHGVREAYGDLFILNHEYKRSCNWKRKKKTSQ